MGEIEIAVGCCRTAINTFVEKMFVKSSLMLCHELVVFKGQWVSETSFGIPSRTCKRGCRRLTFLGCWRGQLPWPVGSASSSRIAPKWPAGGPEPLGRPLLRRSGCWCRCTARWSRQKCRTMSTRERRRRCATPVQKHAFIWSKILICASECGC